jgi:hypothetical protein
MAGLAGSKEPVLKPVSKQFQHKQYITSCGKLGVRFFHGELLHAPAWSLHSHPLHVRVFGAV